MKNIRWVALSCVAIWLVAGVPVGYAAGAPDPMQDHVPVGEGAALTGLEKTLLAHRWTLVDATDKTGQRVEVLFPDPKRPFVFQFGKGSGLRVTGGCNGLRAHYKLDDHGLLHITGAISTRMACEEALMRADAALAKALRQPVKVELAGGSSLRLTLQTEAGETWTLEGKMTHEANLGAPVTLFLEVSAEPPDCKESGCCNEESACETCRCLLVREVFYDAKGLKAREPGAWRIFSQPIDGFEREQGLRYILRIKKFQPTPDAGGQRAPVYLLDQIIESEVVKASPEGQ